MAARTRLGLTGPMAAYGTFTAKAEGAAAARRGKRARGRARLQGRRFWWIVLLMAQWI